MGAQSNDNDALPKDGTSLSAQLSGVLPDAFSCKLRHMYTPPKVCDPLFSPPPGHEAERTRLSSHFFTVSVASSVQNGDPASILDLAGIIVLGIEVLVYTTKHLTTIFVSKADSTGFLPQDAESPNHSVPIKPIVQTIMQWMVSRERRRRPRRTIVVSLFARAQSQYLFPGSAENSRKHVLDDRQLIKWWATVLDPILVDINAQGRNPETEEQRNCAHGYLTVPGFDEGELRQFYPPHSRSTPRLRWQAGHPLRELAMTRGIKPDCAPPRCLLPRFPDDPKARYMQDLDDEVGIPLETTATTTTSPSKRRNGNGKWGSVHDLGTFWEAMGFRQECSSGRMVGFLWVVIPPSTKGRIDDGGGGESQESKSSSSFPSSEPASQNDDATSTSPTQKNPPTRKQRRLPLTGPIIARAPRLKGGSSSTSTGLATMLNNHYSQEGGSITVTLEAYDRAMQTLLHLDFANRDVAAVSSGKWVAEVKGLCGLSEDFGVEVNGTAKGARSETVVGDSTGQVNELSGIVRRKRKVGGEKVDSMSSVHAEVAPPEVNVLGAGMVRKKVKTPVQ